MTNEELKTLLSDKSEDWRKGFFCAVNLTSDSKAAFLKNFIGAPVEVVMEAECTCGQQEDTAKPFGGHDQQCPAAIPF